jgi:hypothetical protein
MKKIITLIAFTVSCLPGFAQTYNSPESVEFDYVNNRWFISNNGDGKILARNSTTGALSVFASSISSGPHGLEIVNDTLYVCDGPRILGFNINTPGASPIFSINIGGTFLNGITHDNSGNLYITDFSAKKIYRFTVATRQYNQFATTGTKTPNGIIYDQANNRCVFVTWGTSAAIMQVSLSDSTVTTAQTTTLSNCDGITRDAAGNYFVSSWGLNGITKFSSALTSPTTVVSSLASPADIFYNVLTDTLGVPNSGTGGINGNKATFHYMGTSTSIAEQELLSTIEVVPNPVTSSAVFNYKLGTAGKVNISLFDEKGALVKVLLDADQPAGAQSFSFMREELAAGIYILKISSEDRILSKKVVIAK